MKKIISSILAFSLLFATSSCKEDTTRNISISTSESTSEIATTTYTEGMPPWLSNKAVFQASTPTHYIYVDGENRNILNYDKETGKSEILINGNDNDYYSCFNVVGEEVYALLLSDKGTQQVKTSKVSAKEQNTTILSLSTSKSENDMKMVTPPEPDGIGEPILSHPNTGGGSKEVPSTKPSKPATTPSTPPISSAPISASTPDTDPTLSSTEILEIVNITGNASFQLILLSLDTYSEMVYADGYFYTSHRNVIQRSSLKAGITEDFYTYTDSEYILSGFFIENGMLYFQASPEPTLYEKLYGNLKPGEQPNDTSNQSISRISLSDTTKVETMAFDDNYYPLYIKNGELVLSTYTYQETQESSSNQEGSISTDGDAFLVIFYYKGSWNGSITPILTKMDTNDFTIYNIQPYLDGYAISGMDGNGSQRLSYYDEEGNFQGDLIKGTPATSQDASFETNVQLTWSSFGDSIFVSETTVEFADSYSPGPSKMNNISYYIDANKKLIPIEEV